MTWVLIIAVVWVVLGLVTALTIGRAIRIAERRGDDGGVVLSYRAGASRGKRRPPDRPPTVRH
ncbi:hypothetical protein [Geodermatophilus sp. SYSU D00815]